MEQNFKIKDMTEQNSLNSFLIILKHINNYFKFILQVLRKLYQFQVYLFLFIITCWLYYMNLLVAPDVFDSSENMD